MNSSMIDDSNVDDSRSSAESSQEFTFGNSSTLRRNLVQTFDRHALPPKDDHIQGQNPLPLSTQAGSIVSDRIQQYETATMGRDIKPPLIPSRKLQPNNPVPSDRFAVYLRVRPPSPCKNGNKSTNNRKRKLISESNLASTTIEILPPQDPKQNPTTVRTYPPPDSNAIKIKSSLFNGKIPTSSTSAVKEFRFHQVLSPDTSQQDFYSVVAAPLVQNLFSGSKEQPLSSPLHRSSGQKSALLFSYGITNAGKTHTMLGTTTSTSDTSKWGVIPRAISDILDRMKLAAIEQGQVSDLYLSCFEVYNEQIFDLLPRKSSTSRAGPPPVLKVREARGQILVRELATHKVLTVAEGVNLTRMANDRRHTSSNNLNSGSSRSHFICQLQVVPSIEDCGSKAAPAEASTSGYTTDEEATSMQCRNRATVWLVDLAGSERAKRTGLGSSRQKEASQINKSLLTLMRCLTAMREKGSNSSNVIPFRESKLTHLFMHHLTGSSSRHTSMVVNVNPSVADFDETQHVLAYASKAKTIQLKSSETLAKQKKFGVEYDMNGRKKARTATMGKQILSKVVNKLSPKSMVSRLSPRKNPQLLKNEQPIHFSQPQSGESLQAILQKKNEEIKSLEGALVSATSEIEKLRLENAGLLEDLQQQERQIRIEVSEEIEERFKATRSRNIQELERLKSKLASEPSLCKSARKAQMDKTDVRIQELLDQVHECEEEMTRLREEHAAEKVHLKSRIRVLEAMKKTVRFDDQTMERVSMLERDLDSSRKQIEVLKNSKKELIENYEKLLTEGDDDDTERSIDSNSNEDDSDFNKKGPILGLKYTSRPPLQVMNRANNARQNNHHNGTEKRNVLTSRAVLTKKMAYQTQR